MSRALGEMIELLEAINNTTTAELIEILESGIDPDVVGPFGNTAMRNAASLGNLEAIDVLVKYGADVNKKIFYRSPVDKRYEEAFRPIFYANNANTLAHLISLGADVNAVSEQGVTPLMVFASWCQVGEIEKLIKHGALVGAEGKETYRNKPITALVLAKQCLRTWEKVYKLDPRNEILDKIENAKKCIHLLSI